jgi:outer membrane protein assembly factor BamB
LISFFLIITIAITIVPLNFANAHTPTWQIPTWAYVAPAPETVGVGQQMSFVMFLTLVPPGSSVNNDIRWRGYTLTITKPDGSNETLGPYSTDSVGTTYALYTPDQVGNYSVTFKFPGQILTTTGTYANDTFLPSQSTAKFIVQQDSIPQDPIFPLPSQYWTRPIEGQNDQWYLVASNWLAGAQCVTPAGVGDDYFQKDGIAPNSAHIMWTKPLEDGGIVGGTDLDVEGNAFYSGTQYNPRFDNPIIMYGRLYTEIPYGNSGGGGGYMCVDLRTGETQWTLNTTGVGVPSFGYYYAYEMYNQHGVVPEGWLFTSNFARAVDPSNGVPSTLNITNVPSGTTILGPSGENLRYTITNIGNTTAPNWRLTQWNSSKVLNTQTSGTINASLPSRYDWNVSIKGFGNGMTSPSIQAIMYDDLILGRNGSLSSTTSYNPYITYWAISLNPTSLGQVLWTKNIEPPPNNMTLMSESAAEGVWIMTYKETMQWLGYDMHTGEKLWGPTQPEAEPFGYFSWTTGGMNTNAIAYGKFFSAGYSGCVYCYDLNNGTLLWKYSADATSSIFARHTTHIGAIADGKIYVGTHEHSANTPLIKDNHVRCVNVTTGEEIWTLMGWGAAYSFAVADGYVVYNNLYDGLIYCIGKGPSAVTVTAPFIATQFGDPVIISGKVTDIAAGAKQNEQAARFPSGVAAVSDASMGQWMEYVYMQKPKPTNTVGVPVSIDVIDANGNFRNIGSSISDTEGFYSFAWTPDISGKYTVIATFQGSESYWPSRAETAFVVNGEAPTPSPEPVVALPPTEMYFVISTAAIIATIIIIGVLLLIAVRKRPIA